MNLIIRKEIEENIKGLIIWSVSMAALVLIMAMLFDSMKSDISNMMATFPQGMLKAFGMEAAPMNRLEGFYSQGYIVVVLMGAMYSAYLGASILVKEEDEGSIEYLMSKPFKRIEIYGAKYISLIIIIVSFNIIVALATIIGALIYGGDNYSKEAIYLMAIAPTLVHLTFGTLCYGIASLLRKNRQAVSLSIGIVSIFYSLSLLRGVSSKLDILKDYSIFDYININVVTVNKYIEPYHIIIMFGIMIISLVVGAIVYNKKDF